MTEHDVALLILSVCWLGIAWSGCYMAVQIKRDALKAIRRWQMDQAKAAVPAPRLRPRLRVVGGKAVWDE
ncbi:MAG TPA: hypothetical protein VNJ04_11930 [Gemmatimonadaceae bacterium]|nr:hypothetical protein [Gemmatimonadaceae bacterium]